MEVCYCWREECICSASGIVSSLPGNTNFGTKHFIMNRIYTDEGGMKIVTAVLKIRSKWDCLVIVSLISSQKHIL